MGGGGTQERKNWSLVLVMSTVQLVVPHDHTFA